MRVSEVMTRNVECINPDATLQEAAKRMKELDVGPLPVCENDHLIGMITDRDLTIRATAEGWDPKSTKVSRAMTPDVAYCYEADDVEEATRLMKNRQIRRLVVLTPEKRVVGIVSLGDLVVETGDKNLAAETLEAVSIPNRPNR